MSRKKVERQPARPAPAPRIEAGPAPLLRIARLIERYPIAVALLFIGAGAIRIAASYSDTGLTYDEPAHLACGMEYLSHHVYRYEPQHPPLARVMTAIVPFLAGARTIGKPNMSVEGVALLYQSGDPGGTLSKARAGILPFFVLASLVVFWWGRRYFSPTVAVTATALFTLLPPILAHGGLATTDMALTACLGLAFLALLIWAERPTIRHSVLLGAATAAAVLSKFTALGFFPVAAGFALAAYIMSQRPPASRLMALAKERAVPFAVAVLTGAIAIWAVYLFSFDRVPAPELFDGVRRAMRHNAGEGGGYLFGRLSQTGFWYFFPMVLVIKTPIGFLLLLAFGAFVCLRRWREANYLPPLALSLGILAPAMTSPVNYGVRHILPVYIGFSIVAALGIRELVRSRRGWPGFAALALVLWMAIAGAVKHPEYLAYMNEFFDREPENVLVDSDLDWGQDTIRLGRRLRELGATQVMFTTMNLTDDLLRVWPGLPPSKPINPIEPTAGWTAVSPTFWKTGEFGLEHRYANLHPWFTYVQPKERVGSLLLYYLPPGSVPPR